MKLWLSAVSAAVIVVVFSDRPAVAQGLQPMGQNGRYAVVTGATAGDVILLDTQTGRTWMICMNKGDSLRTVDNGWCAMRMYGTPTRP